MWFFFGAIIVFKLFFFNNPFFWDTVQLSSKQAHFFYLNSFSSFLLPDLIDSGHPPFMGVLLAGLWKIFGRALWVGHALVTLVLLLFVYQLNKLLVFTVPKYSFYTLLLVVAEATFLSQSTLVSPDIIVLLFFVLGLNGVFSNSRVSIFISSVLLCAVSTRGAMCSLSLFLFCFLLDKKKSWKSLVWFLPGFFVVVVYQYYHFSSKGWILYYEASPWMSSFERVNFVGFIKNIGILIWRLIDNGRVLIFGVLGFMLIVERKNILKNPLFMLWISLGIFTVFPLLLYTNLLGHRYLLPFILTSIILMITLLAKHKWFVDRTALIMVILLLVQLSGNFWVYPNKIAKGWDASLAYLPSNNLLGMVEKDLLELKLKKSEVATGFPLLNSDFYTKLTSDTAHFKDFQDIKYEKWVLYSNLVNGFSDEDLSKLETNFEAVKVHRAGLVEIKLLKNKAAIN